MSMKYGLLSFLALCVCLFTFLKNYEVWTRPFGEVSGNVEERKLAEKPKAPPTVQPLKNPNPIGSPILIAGKNIFSPERKDFPVVPTEQSRQMMRPQVVLYGVTIAGDYQSASVVHPGRPLRKNERETVTLRLGEQISGYKLALVSSDRIRLERAGDSFEVLLYDSKSPKKRSEPKPENRQAVAAHPAGAESKESGTPAPGRVGVSSLPLERVIPQATQTKPQGPTNEGAGSIVPRESSVSLPLPASIAPPPKPPSLLDIPMLRERGKRGNTITPLAPTAPAPKN
jgi:hypothetical protein